jgi:hypothetical protein
MPGAGRGWIEVIWIRQATVRAAQAPAARWLNRCICDIQGIRVICGFIGGFVTPSRYRSGFSVALSSPCQRILPASPNYIPIDLAKLDPTGFWRRPLVLIVRFSGGAR